jgi:NitT/TauT family transport system ATP-binding protein
VLSHRPSRIKSVHEIDLGEDRMDVIAARQAPGFHEYVRAIWSELEVRAGEG